MSPFDISCLLRWSKLGTSKGNIILKYIVTLLVYFYEDFLSEKMFGIVFTYLDLKVQILEDLVAEVEYFVHYLLIIIF